MNLPKHNPSPWYKQFWPWFLIALPGTVVIAALSTVFIAFKNADSEVKDQYYSDGMGINQVLGEDLRATELEIKAELLWDTLTGEILLNLSQKAPQEFPQELSLQLLHPVDKNMDQTIILSQIVDGRYRTDFSTLPQYRYYLRLSPLNIDQAASQWRLQGEINFSQTQQTNLYYR